jgi:hypothetical protein
MSIAIIDEAGQERAVHKLTYGAKLHVKDGQQVKRGTKLFEWDPFTLPIIAEKAGCGAVQGSGLGHLGPRGYRRCHRHDAEDRGRLALCAARRRSEARDHRDGPGHGRAGARRQRQPDHLSDVGGRDSVGRRRAGTAAGRRGGAYPARRCQDQGHHRGSSPRGGTVRGPSSEGSRDHRRRSMAMCASARTTRTSAASPSSRSTRRCSRWNT